jgi:hypothetical protein
LINPNTYGVPVALCGVPNTAVDAAALLVPLLGDEVLVLVLLLLVLLLHAAIRAVASTAVAAEAAEDLFFNAMPSYLVLA